MKKILAIVLSLVMLASCTVAFADTVLEDGTIEMDLLENGAWVAFEDYGFQLCLPGDWLQLELTDEQTAAGVIYSCCNPEQTRSFTLAYSELSEATDMDGVLASLQAVETYTEVSPITINEVPFVTYTVAESDVTGIVTLGGAGIGVYTFAFYPASDADYADTALRIAASFSGLE